jgi:hypothetical protein
MQNDLREIARKKCHKAGRISFNGGRAVTACTIKNLSDGGACLALASAIGIPDSFNLVFDSGEPSRVCQVIWRKDEQIGVAFKPPSRPHCSAFGDAIGGINLVKGTNSNTPVIER